MITIRKGSDRGKSETDWLLSYHSFSFANYFDPQFMGYSDLRVLNDDYIQPGKGFGMHPHQNMEILTYIVEGSLRHQDSLGTGSRINPNEIQRMSAGSGITHSEFNASEKDILHLLQIWILPEKTQITPGYEQKDIPQLPNQLILIGSSKKTEHGVLINQDIQVFCAKLDEKSQVTYSFEQDRQGYVHLIKGEISINDNPLQAGDGAFIQERQIKIIASHLSELLLFDLR